MEWKGIQSRPYLKDGEKLKQSDIKILNEQKKK